MSQRDTEMGRDPQLAPKWSAFAWCVIFLPLAFYAPRLSSFGELQGNDYYGILHRIVEGDELSFQPARWWDLKANEHRVSLPVLAYVANIWLTDGHNLGLTVFSLLLLAVTLILLVGCMPADLRSNPWARVACGFTLALFCFTPVATHSVAMGFSGAIWFFGNALAVASIALLVRRAESDSPWSLWPVLVLGSAAAFTHSTHLALWVALAACALYLRLNRRQLLLLGAGGTWILTLFVFTYRSLARHPAPTTTGFQDLVSYAAVYLGGLFSIDVALARNVGLVALVVSGVSIVLAAVSSWPRAGALSASALRSELAPWLMIQLYGLGNAVMAAVGRAGYGMEQALASRYASLAALFWVGLFMPAVVLAWRQVRSSEVPAKGTRLRFGILLLVVAAVSGLAMHARGTPVMERFLARGSRQNVAALALQLGIADEHVFSRAVTPAPRQIYRVYEYMKATGHVPFHRPHRWRLGERLPASRLSPQPHPELQGEFDRLTEGLFRGFARPSGWAFCRSAAVEEVRVLDHTGIIRGEVFTGIHRPEMRERIGDEAVAAGWEGYAQIDPESRQLRAWARLAGDPLWYPLPTGRAIKEQLRAGT